MTGKRTLTGCRMVMSIAIRTMRRLTKMAAEDLSKNDEQAALNRAWLKAHGVVAVNLISSPGTGKTLLLERTLEGLRGRAKCAVITRDQRTDNDARAG